MLEASNQRSKKCMAHMDSEHGQRGQAHTTSGSPELVTGSGMLRGMAPPLPGDLQWNSGKSVGGWPLSFREGMDSSKRNGFATGNWQVHPRLTRNMKEHEGTQGRDGPKPQGNALHKAERVCQHPNGQIEAQGSEHKSLVHTCGATMCI